MSRASKGMIVAALVSLLAAPVAAQIETVTLPSANSPLVTVWLQFAVGSIDDPPGKEGLAALTANMVGQAGTAKRSYADLLDALYPMAANIQAGSDLEVTAIGVTVHREKLAEAGALLQEALLTPGFAESDFTRNKEQAKAFLTNTLPSNDELLGLAVLEKSIFKGHPYGHPSLGTVAGLAAITLDDVKAFYKQHYTRANLTVGLAGGYPQDYPGQLTAALAALPAGQKRERPLPAPAKVEGRQVTLVEKETGAVGIQFGYALPINRADADFYPLFVANNYLGDHRTFNGRLMQQLRGERGLNYGDYSYIEYWQAPPFTTDPNPGVPRRHQYFSVWIRPVVPEDAQFALRAGLYEVERLRDRGLTKEEFELTRDYLINRTKLWAQSQDDRLGFHMDSKFYGIPYFIDEIEKHLKAMTVEQVNAAVKKYIQTDNFVAVLVTNNAAALKATLEKDAPSPKTYGSQVAEAVLEADKSIQGLKAKPARVDILPVAQVFQK